MYKIYLRPSNKSNFFGVNNFGNEEFRMRQIAEVVEKELLKTGKHAIYISKRDTNIDEIISEANDIKPDVYIALQSEERDIKGVKCYTKDTDEISNGFAKEIYKNLYKIYYDKDIDNGIIYDLTIKELTKVKSPAIIVCVGSRSSIKDSDWIIKNMNEIGRQIADGIQKGFKLKNC